MALVRKWDGIGVSDGALGSKAGPGDTAFDASNLSPSINGETISKSGNTQHYWDWTTSALGAVSVRFHLVQRSAPSGTGSLFQAWNAPVSGRVFALSINTSNQIALRDSSNSAIYTSGPLEMGREYCIDIHKPAGNSTVTLYIRDMMTGGEHSSGGGSVGTSNTVSHFQFGQTSGTNPGGYRYSHMRIEDTNSRIGPYVAEDGDWDVDDVRFGSAVSASSHNVPLPSTEWDDHLIAFLRSGSSTAPAVPGGWVSLGGDTAAGERVIARQATGSEGNSVTVTISGGAHLAAVVYRVRSSRSIKGVFSSSNSSDPPSLGTSPDWSGERNLWLYGLTWVNSNASIVTAPAAINTLVQAYSGSASGRPAVGSGLRRWTGDTLDIGAPSSTAGTMAAPRASAVVLKFDSPTEPPESDNLEWFIWDGETLTPVDALGALEVA